MARGGDGSFAIRTEGLAALNRSLGKISREMRSDSVKELGRIGEKVRVKAVPQVPHRTGVTAGSLKVGATGKGTRIYSLLPQAPVIEYGGTIAPRGTPIKFARTRMVANAIQATDVEGEIDRLFVRISARNGFR